MSTNKAMRSRLAPVALVATLLAASPAAAAPVLRVQVDQKGDFVLLGNTFEASNTLPTVVFELLAAGALSESGGVERVVFTEDEERAGIED